MYVLQNRGTDFACCCLFIVHKKTKKTPVYLEHREDVINKIGEGLANFHTGQCVAVLFHTVFFFFSDFLMLYDNLP